MEFNPRNNRVDFRSDWCRYYTNRNDVRWSKCHDSARGTVWSATFPGAYPRNHIGNAQHFFLRLGYGYQLPLTGNQCVESRWANMKYKFVLGLIICSFSYPDLLSAARVIYIPILAQMYYIIIMIMVNHHSQL